MADGPFRMDGFLSPDVDRWAISNRESYKDHVELAEELNRHGVRLLIDNPPHLSSLKQLVGSLFLARALNAYAAAVLLASRGMVAEARTMVRTCSESAIALGSTATDDQFFDRLESAHDDQQRKIANIFLENESSLIQAGFSEEQKAALRKKIDDVRTKYPDGPRIINWADEAARCGMSVLYNTIYRDTSGDGAHVTLESLNRLINSDEQNNIVNLLFRPQLRGVRAALYLAMESLMYAVEAFTRLFGVSNGLTAYHLRLKILGDGDRE